MADTKSSLMENAPDLKVQLQSKIPEVAWNALDHIGYSLTKLVEEIIKISDMYARNGDVIQKKLHEILASVIPGGYDISYMELHRGYEITVYNEGLMRAINDYDGKIQYYIKLLIYHCINYEIVNDDCKLQIQALHILHTIERLATVQLMKIAYLCNHVKNKN